jgi:mannose-1-phosphate guanylyltransferase
VPVCGLPLVRFSLALLAGAGVRRAVVNVHHLPDAMAAAAAEAARAGDRLAVSREPVIAAPAARCGQRGHISAARPRSCS